MSTPTRREEGKHVAWVACWADTPEDALTSTHGHDLVPGGRWLLELLIPRVEEHEGQVSGIGFEYSGYWWVRVDHRSQRFLLFVYYMGGIGNIRINLCRPLLGWLTGRDFSREVQEFAGLVVEVLQGDRRVRKAGPSSGYTGE